MLAKIALTVALVLANGPTTVAGGDRKDREFWELIRQALLLAVDAIERFQLCYKMTTAQIRKLYKDNR